jgi:hypothetical protein
LIESRQLPLVDHWPFAVGKIIGVRNTEKNTKYKVRSTKYKIQNTKYNIKWLFGLIKIIELES